MYETTRPVLKDRPGCFKLQYVMAKILTTKFFNRPTITVAKELVGKYLVCRRGEELIALKISETEAYDGFEDKASHASRGKTPRNSVMFGPAGYWYVYFTYGMHYMLNIVTGKREYPAAVLIRGGGQYNGLARLTKALGIDKRFNTKRAIPKTGLWIEDRGEKTSSVTKSTRIGVEYAGPIWSKKKYRFILNDESRSPRKGSGS